MANNTAAEKSNQQVGDEIVKIHTELQQMHDKLKDVRNTDSQSARLFINVNGLRDKVFTAIDLLMQGEASAAQKTMPSQAELDVVRKDFNKPGPWNPDVLSSIAISNKEKTDAHQDNQTTESTTEAQPQLIAETKQQEEDKEVNVNDEPEKTTKTEKKPSKDDSAVLDAIKDLKSEMISKSDLDQSIAPLAEKVDSHTSRLDALEEELKAIKEKQGDCITMPRFFKERSKNHQPTKH